jgi:transcriptional regulator GlxA family with amidase domain
MAGQRQFNVALLAVPEVTASTLYGMFDLFSSVGRDFPFMTRGTAGEQRMRPYVVARAQSEFLAANGVSIQPDHDFTNCPPPDIVCVPDFFVVPGESVAGRYDPEAAWLRRMHDQNAMLASACSGAVLLGEAGLLSNCEATIHWAYVTSLTNNYPGVRVKPHQSLILSGAGNRLVMAGGGTSWQDLTLYLIARSVGGSK